MKEMSLEEIVKYINQTNEEDEFIINVSFGKEIEENEES